MRARFGVHASKISIAGFGAAVLYMEAALANSSPPQPAQQSRCEVAANEFQAKHPYKKGMDSFKYFDEYTKRGFDLFNWVGSPSAVQPYRDPATGTTFHVDKDGRQVRAVNKDGKVLWVRNPFIDADMCPYRSAHPYIDWIGAPEAGHGWATPPRLTNAKANAIIAQMLRRVLAAGTKGGPVRPTDRFIGIRFDSSQHGSMKIATGDFYLEGQN